MKLLPKSVVNTEIASQKKKQIDEGLLIAKKVDALRETLASLEKQHKDFLNGMQDELKAQIDPLIKEIAQRKLEITDLEEKRRKLLIPLDTAWDEVNKIKTDITSKQEELSKKEKELKKSEEVLENRLKKEKENVFKINTIRNEIAKSHQKAEENEDKTKQVLESTEIIKKDVLKELEEKTSLIKSREAQVAVKERENNLLREGLDKESKFIKEEKIRLADQRATLERALARINKK